MDGDYLKLLKIAKGKFGKDFLNGLESIENENEKKTFIGKALLFYLENEIDFFKKRLFVLELKGRNVFNLKISTSILENKIHFFKSNYSTDEFYKLNLLVEKIQGELKYG